MQEHHVKSWPQFFRPIRRGVRTHELRRNDRNYQVGDHVHLHEWAPDEQRFTGEVCIVEVMSVTSAEAPCAVSEQGLHPDFIIYSARLLTPVCVD